MNRSAQRGHVIQVSVGRPRTISRAGRTARTAIDKRPVHGPVRAAGVNLDDDDQADRIAHGGEHKAVYAYADEDRSWWEAEVGRTIEPGAFGENLTTRGIDVTSAVVGERWLIGTVVLEVSEPRLPCWKLNHRMSDDRFVGRFGSAGRPGAYLRILTEGMLEAGDSIRVADVPDHGVTVADVARIRRSRTGVETLLAVDAISETWKAWAARTLRRSVSEP